MTDALGRGRGPSNDPARTGLAQSLDAFESGCAELGGRLAPAVRPKIAKAFTATFEALQGHWRASSPQVLAAARFGGHCAAAHAILKGSGPSVEWIHAVYGLLQAQSQCAADLATRDDVSVMKAWCQGVALDADA